MFWIAASIHKQKITFNSTKNIEIIKYVIVLLKFGVRTYLPQNYKRVQYIYNINNRNNQLDNAIRMQLRFLKSLVWVYD